MMDSEWALPYATGQHTPGEPGDVIACGTSIGVAPMKPGNRVSVIIEAIGTLTHRFEQDRLKEQDANPPTVDSDSRGSIGRRRLPCRATDPRTRAEGPRATRYRRAHRRYRAACRDRQDGRRRSAARPLERHRSESACAGRRRHMADLEPLWRPDDR